jgi:hypothetical protein
VPATQPVSDYQDRYERRLAILADWLGTVEAERGGRARPGEKK